MEKGFMEQGLIAAALLGHTEIVQLLLENGADVNAKDYFGLTPFMIAIAKGHTEIAQLLLEKGADVNTKIDGKPILLWAAAKGHTETVQLPP
jgi:ankyrin repeat protein